MNEYLQKTAKALPDHPGIYFWKNKNNTILYIGKATSLKSRVSSYFRNDIELTKKQMVRESSRIDYKLTDTILEALILETKYIKQYKPKYNIVQKDDKSMAYLAFSKEDYPRLFIIRAREYERYLAQDSKMRNKYKILKVFGPFLSANTINKVLKIIISIIPYRKCNYPPEKICLYGRINQCPLHRDKPLTKDEYKKNLDYISRIFSGKMPSLYTKIKKDMETAAKIKNFEFASQLRDELFALQHINDISLIEDSNSVEGLPARLEAYDISHFGGKGAVGAFVVFENGKNEKSQYRKFIIRGIETQDDLKMTEEVLTRRFKHNEWLMPEMILIDGGIEQLKVAESVINKLKIDNLTLLASAKGKDRKQTNLIWSKPSQKNNYNQKQLLKLTKSAQSEAHRFAITFQKTKRKLH